MAENKSEFKTRSFIRKSKHKCKSVLTFIMVLTLAFSFMVGTTACGSDVDEGGTNSGADDGTGSGNNDGNGGNGDILTSFTPAELLKYEDDLYDTEFKTTSSVGVSGRVIDTVARNIPAEAQNEGLAAYPKYGYTLKSVIGTDADKVAARNALIKESAYLASANTSHNSGSSPHPYNMMDAEGKLYFVNSNNEVTPSVDDEGNQRRLYKHTAADGLYLGNVSDDEPGIIKEVTMRPRQYSSYGVTGVYAPAGEVIKITLSEADMNATGGITIHIGQALYNGQANNIWTAKNQMNRMPVILNTMVVNKNTATLENGVYTAYVGSFVGGPLYIRNSGATFTATISGGVAYSHFILGYTTKEEFEQNAQSSAPYFDLEVWNYGVLHSGPKAYAKAFSYEDIYKVAVLWDKVASVTTTGSSQGIVFIYDSFVAAGAAVAFPGRRSVNCPNGWMSGSLNYNGIVTSGSWGNFHEYHHNFQNYGVGDRGEVTNNALTLVSYSLFTKISSKRGISSYGAQGLGGWNNYTSAPWALQRVINNQISSTNGLAVYATLLHNLGQDAFIKTRGASNTAYWNKWQTVTHQNMSYYAGLVSSYGGAHTLQENDYPMFVPVSSVYQTGRSYMYDDEKKFITTMQPYVIAADAPFTVDLRKYSVTSDGQYVNGSIVIPNGFSYKIKKISTPQNGTLTETSESNVFTYTPDVNSERSGKIVVTLEITKDDKAFTVDDVDLVLEFEMTHETNKLKLERTTYTYDAANMFTDAQTAYENNFGTYSDKSTQNHTNPTQNCNTDIWFYANTAQSHTDHPNSPESHFVHDNTIEEINGKLYIEDEGRYRLYLRGRMNCALYYSTDGGITYNLGATIKDKTVPAKSWLFRPNDANTYVDLDLEAESWLYIKEILIVQSSPTISYIGAGLRQWTEPMFTMVEKHYDAANNEVSSVEDENYDHTVTKYYDYQGLEVTEEQANNAELIAPVVTENSQPYINAYRNSYKFPSNNGFETDYFYTRNYSYEYSDTYNNWSEMSVVACTGCPDNFPLVNLLDGDTKTACSSTAIVSAANPWEVTVDMGKVVEANRFELIGRLNNGASNQNQTPNSITLYLGETLDNMVNVMEFDNGAVSGVELKFNFDTTSFRYYKLVVRKTVQGRFAAISNITFKYNVAGGTQYTPDSEMFNYSGAWIGVQAQSTFGHVYVGKQNSKMSFEFTGTRLVVLSSALYERNYEVWIDGAKFNSVNLKEVTDAYGAYFMSPVLANEKHSVEIRCTGEATIDSIVVYK